MPYGLSTSSYAMPVYIVGPDGELVHLASLLTALKTGAGGGGDGDLDTTGAAVPTYKPQTFTYDDSGNLKTATVSDGASTWVRTYGWNLGALSSDSGWVKQ